MIGFEISSLSILFNSSLKKVLYDRPIKLYRSELHRLRDFYRFSIYVDLVYVLIIILLPEFSINVNDAFTLTKSIIVFPILLSSLFCLIWLCNDLFHIFVYPTNEK